MWIERRVSPCVYNKQNLRFVDQIRKYWEKKNSHLFSLAACLLNFCHFWCHCHWSHFLWSWWLERMVERSFVCKEPCWRLELWRMQRILRQLLVLLHHKSLDWPSLHQTSSCSKHDHQHFSENKETLSSFLFLPVKNSRKLPNRDMQFKSTGIFRLNWPSQNFYKTFYPSSNLC